jgi:type IV fimbrial biogenesis protein FimT
MSYGGFRVRAGFTLTELLTTLAVIVIVLSAGVPGVRQFVADNRRAAQTNYLLTAFERARSEARRTTRVVSVCPSRDGASCAPGASDWHKGFIVFANDDRASPGTLDARDELLEVYEPVRGSFTLKPSRAVAHYVAFEPSGAAMQGGEFVWCDSRGPRAARAVILQASGSASVSSMTASGRALSCAP